MPTFKQYRSWVAVTLLAAGLGSCQAPATVSDLPCLSASSCWDLLDLSGGLRMPHYRTHSLKHANQNITRAVIIIHGNSRNADSYFSNMVKAAMRSNKLSKTLIVAPHFSISSDAFSRSEREVYWRRSNHWKRGNLSSRDYKNRISSFAVIDEIVTSLSERKRFPSLRKIIIAGHSAGGQFVQRYVVGRPEIRLEGGLAIRYVIANPGRYFYLNALRPGPEFKGSFAVPRDKSDCDYNRYEYGLEQRNAYMNRASAEELLQRFRKRDVVLLLGVKDNDPNHRSLSTSCGAMLQGRHRLERGLMFKAHIDRYFAPHQMRLMLVPGVGHSNRGMFQSAEGRRAIFN